MSPPVSEQNTTLVGAWASMLTFTAEINSARPSTVEYNQGLKMMRAEAE